MWAEWMNAFDLKITEQDIKQYKLKKKKRGLLWRIITIITG